MKVIQGTVLSIKFDKTVQSQAGKDYLAYQLVYNDEAGEVKDWTKPMQGLKFKPNVAKVLQELKVNDPFTLAMEKNSNNFFDIVSLEKGHKDVTDAGNTPIPSGETKAPATRVTGSTYETADERKIKQRSIVRQSSISNALQYFEFTKAVKVSVEDVLTLASQFEAFVFQPVEKE